MKIMKEITVYYSDNKNVFNTAVEYNTVDEAITAVKEELAKTEYTVLEEKTKEQFELDTQYSQK